MCFCVPMRPPRTQRNDDDYPSPLRRNEHCNVRITNAHHHLGHAYYARPHSTSTHTRFTNVRPRHPARTQHDTHTHKHENCVMNPSFRPMRNIARKTVACCVLTTRELLRQHEKRVRQPKNKTHEHVFGFVRAPILAANDESIA